MTFRLEQFKAFSDANRFKVDVVRLKNDATIKPKVNVQNEISTTKPNEKLVSIVKSEKISVLKPDECLGGFFGSTDEKTNENASIQLNIDDLNRISENAVR